jgi:hypothetical protein
MLTPSQIQELANRQGVRRIAVENSLSTLGHEGAAGKRGALRNLSQDARDYRWNAATQNAIRRGIALFFK